MTNLSALAILFGKSTSRLLAALLLLAVQLPFTLLCVTLGGVSQTQVWSAYAILGATTFFLCNLGLFASVYCKTTIRAGFLTGFFGAILYFGLPVLYFWSYTRRAMRMVTGGGPTGPPGTSADGLFEQISLWILQANPVWGLGNLLQSRGFGAGDVGRLVWTSLGAGVFLFLLSWLLFDRFCTKTSDEGLGPRVKNRQGKVRRLAKVPRPGVRWPLAWKDFHFMVGGRFGMYLRFVLAGLGYLLAYTIARYDMQESLSSGYYGSYRGEETYLVKRMWENVAGACMVGSLCVVGLEILLVTGRIFGVERRRLTLSSLVGLPWKTGRVIRQKILGCLPIVFPWLILAAVGFALIPEQILPTLKRELSEIRWRSHREEISVMLYVGLQTLLFLITIMWFSLRIRRGALPSAIVIIGMWNFLFVLFLEEFHRSAAQSYLIILVGVWLTFPAVVLMARAVYYRLQLVAAED